MTPQLAAVDIDAASDMGVRNSQSEGIGRVNAIGGLACWNNLGRNVVFADTRLRPLAVYGSTLFPGEDEPSQYDLDIHAVLDLPEVGTVAVLNHFGTVRCFRRADLLGPPSSPESVGPSLVEPTMRWSFAADVERTVAAAGRLVGSRPRSEGAEGLLVSAPIGSIAVDGPGPVRWCGQELGEVTALGVVPSPDSPLIVVGGDGRLTLAPLLGDHLGPTRWEAQVGFRVACVAWHGGAVWAAGPERMEVVDDYDWEQLKGGGFAALDVTNGRPLVGGSLPDDVAWGTGGVAVVPFGRMLVAVGRTGRVHLIDPGGRTGPRSTAPLTDRSLGIAHTSVVGQRVLFGFNRGGYRLHAFGQPDPSVTRPPLGAGSAP